MATQIPITFSGFQPASTELALQNNDLLDALSADSITPA
jgi:hypothetical protein